jgi:hypothetical protein
LVRKLVADGLAGRWVRLRDLLEVARLVPADVPTNLWVTWLKYPSEPSYAVVVFFDDQSQWSSVAVYNAGRLVRETSEPGEVNADVV